MRLVLEGGGSRAAYEFGVLASLHAAKLPVEAVVGSSTGSLNAAFYAAGQIAEGLEIWTQIVPGNRFISWRRQFTPWGKPGLDLDDMCDNVCGSLLDRHEATSGSPRLYVTATCVDTQSAHVVRPNADNIIDWLRASIALPVGYNRVVELEGRSYVDGGIAAPIAFDDDLDEPVSGPTVVILTRRLVTKKPPPVLWERMALRLIVPRAIREVAMYQHDHYNRVMDRLRAVTDDEKVIVVEPPEDMPLSRLTRDKDRIERAVDMGRRVGDAVAERLMR